MERRWGTRRKWLNFVDPLIALAHELAHAANDVVAHEGIDEVQAVSVENNVRALFR